MRGRARHGGTRLREGARVPARRECYCLGDADGLGIPYLPELPSRGPGADLVGRSAALLADLAVDLQPSGWRFTDRAGRDLARTRAFWRRDLDELAEAYDGYAGPLKVQVAGPWTLAASIELNRATSSGGRGTPSLWCRASSRARSAWA